MDYGGAKVKKTDVLVIGGSVTGLVAAMTAKSSYPLWPSGE